MTEKEPSQEYPLNNEADQLDDYEEIQLPEGVTIEAVRERAREIDLGVTYDEIFEMYQEAYGGTEEDLALDVFEAGDGQKEEGDSIETVIELGLHYMALSLGLT